MFEKMRGIAFSFIMYFERCWLWLRWYVINVVEATWVLRHALRAHEIFGAYWRVNEEGVGEWVFKYTGEERDAMREKQARD